MIFLFVAGLLSVSTALGQDHKHENVYGYRAEEDGPSIVVITWEVYDTDIISDYVLQRSLSGNNSDFQSFNARCTQSGRSYRCEDSELYKGSSDETAAIGNVFYRLNVTHNDGTSHIYFKESASYTTNAVRRTWGSIKSMFQ